MWLIQEDKARDLERAYSQGFKLSAAQQIEFADTVKTEALGNLKVAGNVAEIRVEGVLTAKPDFIARFLLGGNTTYQSIRAALSAAQSDDGIKKVHMFVDSPGGQIEGLFDTLAALQAFAKPIEVTAARAASAAYALAASAGKITATSPAAEFGSIGILTSVRVDDDVVHISSTDAPNKRPDVRTEEGKAVVREQLDAVHELFVDAIATGRGVKVANVNANFGRGSVLLAGAAKRVGMIDRISRPQLRAVSIEEQQDARAADGAPEAVSKAEPTSTTETVMNKKELQEKHPELYGLICQEAKAEGVTEGTAAGEAAERKRVNAHLKIGKSAGAMEIALTAIAEGRSFMDEEVQADYMAAAMNKRDIDTRQSESDEASAAVNGADASETEEDLGDKVVARLEGKKTA